MLKTVFYLMLSGCPEAAGQCQTLQAPEIAFASFEACESSLLRELDGKHHDWPTVYAICVAGETGVAAVAPANWPKPGQTILTASR